MENVLNIHHMEMKYEVIDCDDKIVVLRPPAVIDARKYKALKAVSEYMKSQCGAREVVIVPEFISDMEVSNVEHTIELLDRTIEGINKIKARLEKMR